MMDALLVSNVVLWLLVIGLTLTVLALTRQIGLLHERISPIGALAPQARIEVGDPAPDRSEPYVVYPYLSWTLDSERRSTDQ